MHDTIRLLKEHSKRAKLDPSFVHDLAVSSTDPKAREVRIQVAKGLFTIGHPKWLIARAMDVDPYTVDRYVRA